MSAAPSPADLEPGAGAKLQGARMPTGYQPLLLPNGLGTDTTKLIRDQLEPQLVDVHAMLRFR